MKTRIFTLIVSLFITAMAFAYDVKIDRIYYNLDTENRTAIVTSDDNLYYSYYGNIIIPSSISYKNETYSVTSIGARAFYRCSEVTSITIPNSVTSIGYYAFQGTSWLNNLPDGCVYAGSCLYEYKGKMPENTHIDIKEGTTQICPHAFEDCESLTSITIPNSVTSIGYYAFNGCSGLTSVTIGNSVTSIETSAFEGCSSLSSVTIGNSVTSIGENAFRNCSSLTSITIPNSVTSIGNHAFQSCSSLTSITIPEGVTKIGLETFKDCKSLKSIEIPNSITMIVSHAFEGCSSLTSITIPEGVTEIGYETFKDCKSLKSIEIPNSVTKIWNNAFASSGIKSIKLGANVTFSNTHVFFECNYLTDIHWNIKNHPDFYDSENLFHSSSYYSFDIRKNIKTFTFGDSVKYIPNRLCKNLSNLTSVTISNSVTKIGGYAFEGCSSLTSITIPDSVTSIGPYAFSDCSSLASINIPNGVTTIEYFTFYGCSSLTSITIPNSVTSIDDHAFDFIQLKELVIEATNPPSLGDFVFEGSVMKYATVKVPCSSISTYQTTEGWKDFTNFVGVGLPPLLTINVNDASMGVASITKQNSCEDNIAQVEAKANAGYKFVRWSDGNTENPRKITVTKDMTLTAEFAVKIEYTVTLNCDANKGTVSGGGKYEKGTEISIKATPNKGYHFVKWSDGNTENPRTITVTEDINLTAEFAIDQYQIILESNGNGSVTGSGTYDYGTKITIEAIADKGYHFEKWSDGNTKNPRTITVTEDINLTAEFAIDQYQVTLKSNGNGSVTGSGTYDYGTKVTIEAIADKGYHFEKWSDGNIENPRTITVTENIELSATFELDETPVENVQITSANVYSANGRLHVEGAETDYYVLDMAGRLIYSGRDTELQLPRGVYVVNVGGEVQKVVL